jgi:hypothetical protein
VSQECENLNTCGFFQKHRATRELTCRGFVNLYCTGGRMNECKRREYREKNGRPAPDDMLPNGKEISE